MKPITTQFLSPAARTVVVAAALFATLALAGPAPAAPDARSHADRVEARITMLHAKLAITAAQEPAWQNLTQVMRENAQTMEALRVARADKAPTVTALDDLKSYAEIATAHAEGLKKFLPVFETLYGNMSEAQKAQADTLFRGPQHNHRAAKKMSKAQSDPSASPATSTK
jgi:periplasmic protein CpxP/Spy